MENKTKSKQVKNSNSDRIGFGRRFGALFLDLMVIGVVGSIVGMLAGSTLMGWLAIDSVSTVSPEGSGVMQWLSTGIGGMIGTLVGPVLVSIMVATYEAFTGLTPGKMILGIHVNDPEGSEPSMVNLWVRAFVKNIYYVFMVLFMFTGLQMLGNVGVVAGTVVFIGCLFALGANKMALHDMIARTAVYKK